MAKYKGPVAFSSEYGPPGYFAVGEEGIDPSRRLEAMKDGSYRDLEVSEEELERQVAEAEQRLVFLKAQAKGNSKAGA